MDGFGLPVVSSVVHAVIAYQGSLIAAGEFSFAGGQRVNHIARWDGSRWTPLGDGFDGTVFGLAVFEGRLIAGGEFVRSGTIQTGCIAQWDGSQWSALGRPAMGCVHALARHGATLVACGCFATDTGVRNVGVWDGAAWSPLGEGIDGHVFALATYRGEIVAGGEFDSSGTTPLAYVARFDGTSWQPVGTGVQGASSTAVHALAVLHDELIAGGWFDQAGGVPVRSIARWNGAAWDSMPGSPRGMYQSFLVEADELAAAGYLQKRRKSRSRSRAGTAWPGASRRSRCGAFARWPCTEGVWWREVISRSGRGSSRAVRSRGSERSTARAGLAWSPGGPVGTAYSCRVGRMISSSSMGSSWWPAPSSTRARRVDGFHTTASPAGTARPGARWRISSATSMRSRSTRGI